jgi:hypothetical protein
MRKRSLAPKIKAPRAATIKPPRRKGPTLSVLEKLPQSASLQAIPFKLRHPVSQ